MHSSVIYPENYGFIPDTLGDDGDPNEHLLTGVEVGDTISEAIDKVLDYLTLVEPEKPKAINEINLIIQDSYGALAQGTGVSTPYITAMVTPTATTDDLFGDTQRGTVTAYVNTVSVGSRACTKGVGNNNGTYTNLTLSDEEAYSNIYQRLNAVFLPTAGLTPSNAAYPFKLEHGVLFTLKNVYIDNPVSPTISYISSTAAYLTTPNYTSGVPSVRSGDTLRLTFNVLSAVSFFYNPTRIARVESSCGADGNVPLPSTPPATSATVSVVLYSIAALSDVYSEGIVFSLIGYNSRAGSTAEQASDTTTIVTPASNIRIDTKSDESIRVKSGEGQYPLTVVGDAFDSTENLNAAGNEELQLLDAEFQFPTGNYTLNTPTAGPNYSSISGGVYSNMRWATFDLGAVTTIKSVSFNIVDPVNFGSIAIVPNLALYVKIEGSTGWVDGNTAYPGFGNPVSNGDAALDVGSSTEALKRITFGTTLHTGNLLVRIGVPQGGSKKFKRIVLV